MPQQPLGGGGGRGLVAAAVCPLPGGATAAVFGGAFTTSVGGVNGKPGGGAFMPQGTAGGAPW